MGYRFEFRTYCRPFRQPLQTRHGVWSERRGIIVRLVDEAGRVGWGEIAPLAWFGSERLEEALAWCQGVPQVISEEMLWAVPERLPACRFGLEMAWEGVGGWGEGSGVGGGREEVCVLLPTGMEAIEAWRSPYAAGHRTFKWKIGVNSLAQELAWFLDLMGGLPEDAMVRLDANGGLTWDAAGCWLEVCDRFPNVEFLEQPLPPEQFEAMQNLQQHYRTAIALDESVAHLRDLEACYAAGWRGIFVVKVAIAGSPQRLRAFCRQPGVDVVLSSVFETAIGQKYILQHLARSLMPGQNLRVPGFGVNHWFAESALDHPDFDHQWQSLKPSCNTDSPMIG